MWQVPCILLSYLFTRMLDCIFNTTQKRQKGKPTYHKTKLPILQQPILSNTTIQLTLNKFRIPTSNSTHFTWNTGISKTLLFNDQEKFQEVWRTQVHMKHQNTAIIILCIHGMMITTSKKNVIPRRSSETSTGIPFILISSRSFLK